MHFLFRLKYSVKKVSSLLIQKSLFVSLCFLMCISMIPNTGFAQSNTNINSRPIGASNLNRGVEFPSIAIHSLRMKEYVFTPGATINALMIIENIMSSASEFRYKIRLMPVDTQYLATSTAEIILSASPFSEKIVLRPNEKKQIELTHTIPSYIGTNASLQVVAYNDAGIEVGSKQVYLWNTLLKKNTQTLNGEQNTSQTSFQTNKGIIIDQVQFTQDKKTFIPKGKGSAYLLKKDADLEITLNLRDQRDEVAETAFVLVDVSNIHSTSSFGTVRYGVTKQIDSSTITLTVPSSLFGTGVYSIEITPVNKDKKELGTTRRVIIGVEGVSAVIQAFDIKGRLPAKKGDIVTVLADWIPTIQISKELTSDLEDSDFDTVFSARITLADRDGLVIASSTIDRVEAIFTSSVVLSKSTDSIVGKIEILANNAVIASYEKSLLTPIVDDSTSVSMFSLLRTLLVLIILCVLVIFGIIFYKKHTKKDLVSILILFSVTSVSAFPAVASASWTQLGSSFSLDHVYPEAYDSSSTTWQNGWLGGVQVPAWSYSCVKRTDTTGVNSNYVSYTNYPVSQNNRMYRGEYTWHKVTPGGLIWYWVDKEVDYEQWPVVYPAGPYTRTAFVHESMLKRGAKLLDNINYPSYPSWMDYRPFRISLSQNLVSALDTVNFSNLNQWLQAYYTAYRGYDYAVNRDYVYNDVLSNFIPGAKSAGPAESFEVTAERMVELGVTNDDLIVKLDAGSFLSPSAYNQAFYGLVGDSSGEFDYDTDDWSTYDTAYDEREKLLASRPGTYTLFNFLYTTRDEIDVTDYDCVSSNIKVFTNEYEVVANSYLNIVIFNDKNGNGIKDAGEKSISNLANPEGYPALPGNAIRPAEDWLDGLVACETAESLSGNQIHPNYYEESSSDIAFLSTAYDGEFKLAVASVVSSDQVISPSYISDQNYMYNPIQTPYYWSNISGYGPFFPSSRGFGSPSVYYNEQGKAVMYSGSASCLHAVVQGVPNPAWPDEYNDQVNLYPAPASITDGSIAYYKLPVNPEMSTEYTAEIDTTILPDGWVPTKEASAESFEKVIPVTNENTNHVVYLGIKYDAPQGQCGIATSTVQLWEPYENLCAEGSTLNGVVRDSGQYFDWTCLGETISPTCIQRKCEAGLTFCTSTNTCLASCSDDGETATSSLIFGARLNPRIVRDADSQCTLYWNVNATEDTGVSCTLDGTAISSDPSSVSRSIPVSVGPHTLSCTNGVGVQSTSTRCLLNASFIEI